jgi:hypothetical protein
MATVSIATTAAMVLARSLKKHDSLAVVAI